MANHLQAFENCRKQTLEAARRAILDWIEKVKQSGLDCFDKFIGTLTKRLEIITN